MWTLPPDATLPATLALALTIDAWIGDPAALYRIVPHPVALIGRLLERLEARWNSQTAREATRRVAGAGALALAVGLPTGLAAGASYGLGHWEFGWLAEAALGSLFLAQRSLARHVEAVAQAFDGGGLPEARDAVSHIVGRDPLVLDETGVCRAAIESCAENFSDGVAAPVFWFALFGLPGVVAYKAINTADSMIGHKSDRYRAFGWAAARLDDGANWLPARLSGLSIAVAAAFTPRARAWSALKAMARDARLHRSLNAGWPEGAMAGAFDISLAGPRAYRGRAVEDPYLNAGASHPTRSDIRRSVGLIWRAWGLIAAIAALWLLWVLLYNSLK